MRGAFITGTGTGVGKSVVAAALAAEAVADGGVVVAAKPLLSGLDDAAPVWPHDHALLALITGEPADTIAPHRYGPAVSPHLAARWVNERHTPAGLAAEIVVRHAAAGGDPFVVVEGAGGLLVPIDDAGATIADLAQTLQLPLLIAAHPGLGTINHVQLTLEAARARSLPVAAVVLTPWPHEPDAIEADNAEYLAARTGVPILHLPRIAAPTPALLAAAGTAAGLRAAVEAAAGRR